MAPELSPGGSGSGLPLSEALAVPAVVVDEAAVPTPPLLVDDGVGVALTGNVAVVIIAPDSLMAGPASNTFRGSSQHAYLVSRRSLQQYVLVEQASTKKLTLAAPELVVEL